jgi:tritrans,polycis-undecaprenyl-diphosphate synthase [geranylgeranyl-diphosphate specific]
MAKKKNGEVSTISSAITEGVYRAYETRLQNEIKQSPIPKHVAIIMDGNRRFAEALGMDPAQGHVMGRDKLEQVIQWCLDIGIKVLTVYAFSTENIKRSSKELKALMDLFAINFREIGDDERVHKNHIRIRALGQVELLPKNVQEAIHYAEKRTKDYDDYFFNIAIAYGGREEIVEAIKKMAKDVKSGKLSPEKIDQKVVSSYLYTKDVPDPDLILRTSGEERISNFLLWQLAYSELYFSDVYWPGLRKVDFLRAIREYQRRQRRFGE